jgi:hypothetical protein
MIAPRMGFPSRNVGFLNLDRRKFQFQRGIELIETFTQNRRDFNFDQMKRMT